MQDDSQPANDTQRPSPADMPAPDGSDTAGVADTSEMQRELEMYRDRYLRLAAEFDNYRKRTAAESQQLRARGQGELIKTMLDSLDDLSRFAHLDPAATDSATVVQGAEMVERNLQKALANAGVEVIDPVEMPFDPNLHEAVTTAPAESPDEDHMVGQVFQRGYMLNGQLLRPARVVVKQY